MAGFDCYVTREDIIREKKGEKRERIVIEPTDTKHTLKRKRNNGCCEYTGCDAKDKLEWHHEPSFFSKQPPQQTAEGGCGGRGGGGDGGVKGVYRKISDYKPTSNPHVINAYEQQLQQCSLLCKIHHEHTHTHLERKFPSPAAADRCQPSLYVHDCVCRARSHGCTAGAARTAQAGLITWGMTHGAAGQCGVSGVCVCVCNGIVRKYLSLHTPI